MVNLVVNIPSPMDPMGYEIIQPFAPTRRPFYNHWIPIKVMSSEGDALEITVKTFMQSLLSEKSIKTWSIQLGRDIFCSSSTILSYFIIPVSIKNWMGPNPNGPRSLAFLAFFDTQGFFGLRETWVVVELVMSPLKFGEEQLYSVWNWKK